MSVADSSPAPDSARRRSAGWRGPSVARATYGLIVVMSVIAVWTAEPDPDGVQILVSAVATSLVFWIAHVYSAVLETRVREERDLTRSEFRGIIDHEWPLVEVAIAPVLILVLGVVNVLNVILAVDLALWLCLAELGALGYYASWRSGARGLRLVVLGGISLVLGLAIVLLKTLLH